MPSTRANRWKPFRQLDTRRVIESHATGLDVLAGVLGFAPWNEQGTNAIPRDVHSSSTSRQRWSARLNRFCTQTILCGRQPEAGDRVRCFRPIPSINPSSRAVTIPAEVHYGRQDVLVPAAHGEWLASHVPGAKVVVNDDEGHGVLPERMLELLKSLIGPH